MAIHSSTLAWKIPWTEDPDRLQSMGSQSWTRLSDFIAKSVKPVKNLPAIQDTQVRSLGREDPLEKAMAIHCSTIAWKIPWTEEPGRLQSMGLQRVGHD